ncbi:unnamed protein product [Leptidea sinapis]|uniref:Uncharacterized protein n=1 Tax=Leptidea sinapis TaxID=189913 RepID=A0A5E4QPS7_9NEOP|nr:unnamed protein product [Leptidea sinapis]
METVSMRIKSELRVTMRIRSELKVTMRVRSELRVTMKIRSEWQTAGLESSRPARMNEYGLKIIPDYTDLAYKEAVSKLKYFLSGNNAPSIRSYGGSASIKNLDESDIEDKKYLDFKPRPRLTTKYTTLYADSLNNYEELNNLLGKVKEVISENEHLHEAQKNKLISRMFHTYNAGSETDELDDAADSTGLDSDNKGSPSKSRRSGHSRVTKLEGPNIVFESRISELEAQLTQSKIDLKKLQEENNECKRKLASGLVDSTCLDGFKRQIDNLQRDKSSLESQIAKLKLSLDNKDDDGRYKRSDVIEQQLRDERNNLELEIRRLKDDLAAERNKVRELAGETARRAQQERNAAEHRYNQHFDDLQHDLAAQQRREENELKRELSMKNAALEEIKMELKNKTASLQADLAQAHAEKASLEEELASARLAMERQQRQAKHESNRLNSEIQSVRQRLDRADADLLNMKSLTPMTPEKKKKEKELSSMLESMENKHAKTVAELECMIQSQNSLMEKLTSECRLLTDKLDDANRRAQCRSRVDEPIKTQHAGSVQPTSRSKRRVKESDSSNNYPIIVGPLTTNQDLRNEHGEKIYNLPLMIQQPFLREKKEPIKVDISVKLIPKPRKRDKKKRDVQVEGVSDKCVKNSISMEVVDDNIHLLKETVEVYKDYENNSPIKTEKVTLDTIEIPEQKKASNELKMEDDEEILQIEIPHSPELEPKTIEAVDDEENALIPEESTVDKE